MRKILIYFIHVITIVCFVISTVIIRRDVICNKYITNCAKESQDYLLQLFTKPISEIDNNIFYMLLSKQPVKIKVFIPITSCGACAINLIEMIHQYGFTNDEVLFVFDQINIPVLNELKMCGYKKYDICTEQLLEEIDSMYITFEEDGRPIRYLKYFQDNPYVLKVFLSNS